MSTHTRQKLASVSLRLYRYAMPVAHTLLSILVIAAVFMSCVSLSLVLNPLK